MLCLKYKITIVLLLANIGYAQKFDSQQCLDSKVQTFIQSEGRFFGLLKSKLSINKSECTIEVKLKEILETKWVVDICREPIHIKVTSKGSQRVYKRAGECQAGSTTQYCVYWRELYATLQDYGLIFAQGERENIKSSHGQTYCSYLLLKEYLGKGVLFSKYDTPPELFSSVEVIKQKIKKTSKLNGYTSSGSAESSENMISSKKIKLNSKEEVRADEMVEPIPQF